MTPKEKAIELVEDMHNAPETGYNEHAKECALIAVDEIIQGYEFDSLEINHKRIIDNINFWDEVKKEVKKEIEKL
jgi:hypothetical protein